MKTILPQSRFLVFVFLIASLFFTNLSFGQIVMLDQADLDYAPGETVYITGSGWQPGETVMLEVDNLTNPDVDCGSVSPQPHVAWTIVADENGDFSASWYVNDCELGADLLLGAYGESSGFTYEVFFTDGNSVTFNTPTQIGTVNSGIGGSVSYSFNITRDGAGNTFTTTLSTSNLPSGVTASFSPSSLTFAPGASLTSTLTLTVASTLVAGSYSFTVLGSGGGSNNNINLLVSGCNAASITTQPSNQAVTYGSNATFSVVAGGTAPLTYQWQENSGSGFSNISNGGVYSGATTATLTLTKPTVAMSSRTYRCVVTNSCGSANSNGATLSVNTRAITVTASANTKTYDGNTSAAAFPTITSGTLASGDVAVFSETYDNKNQGTNKTMTPAVVSIVDGSAVNMAANYAVTLTNSTNGVINAVSTSVTVVPTSVQYSDQVTLTATINSSTAGMAELDITGGTVKFKIQINTDPEIELGSEIFASGFTVSKNFIIKEAPGTYKVIAVFIPNSINLSGVTNDNTGPLVVNQEDARVEFTGTDIVATQSATSSVANVLLRATIQDITATADAAGDSDFGDIRNAKVRFIVNDNILKIPGVTDGDGWLSNISLINPSDIKTGTVSLAWSVNIGSSDYADYTVRVEVGGYYTRSSSQDNVVLTVYKPTGDFITGGGYIVPTQSAGTYASDAGKKTNFGFNVKYNKSGKSLQGNMNFIFRKMVSGVVRVYQVKSNSMQSLGVNISNVNAKTAVFVSKCNLKDITDPLAPIALGGNLLMQVNMVDKGEPGVLDEIGFTLYDGNTLLYSSNWVSNNTVKKVLSGGNLVVHSGFSVGSVTAKVSEAKSVVTVQEEAAVVESTAFNAIAYPNPSVSQFNVAVEGNSTENIKILVYDSAGRLLKVIDRKAGEPIQFGEDLPIGSYITKVSQGTDSKTINVMKR